MNRRFLRTAVFGLALLAACERGPTAPEQLPTLSISPLPAALFVGEEQRLTAVFSDPARPERTPPPIRWQTLDPEIVSVSQGGNVVALRSGKARVVATADKAADTALVFVERTPARIDVQTKPSRLFPGDTLRFTAAVYDTEGAQITGVAISWESSDTVVATIDGTGLLAARADGTTTVHARVRSVTGWEEVIVRATQCGETGPVISLAPGESRTFSGITSLCLAGGSAKYGVVAHNDASSGHLSLEVRASGGFYTWPVDLSLSLTPAAPALGRSIRPRMQLDRTFEMKLRMRERRELAGLMARRSLRRATPIVMADHMPDTGTLVELNVSASCSKPDIRVGRVKTTSGHAVIIADTANPKLGTSDSEYWHIAREFDGLAYGPGMRAFGAPTDVDGNGKVIIFYTRAVNELTPSNSDQFVGGFMWAGDLLPKSECASSNQAEIFYMQVPDRNGEVNGNKVDPYVLRDQTVGIAAHELQHVINAGRRIYVNGAASLEEVWLNEGLSHIAEELAFYQASGHAPGQNISLQTLQAAPQTLYAANKYVAGNFANLGLYLQNPELQSPFQNDDDLQTRGAIWQFLRYAADRRGGDQNAFWHSLVNATSTGRANLQRVLGVDPTLWAHDAQVAQWLDMPKDPARTSDARFLHPSWEFRSLVGGLFGGRYPLRWHSMQPGTTLSLALVPAGAAYLSGAVYPGQSAEIRFTSGGAAPPSRLRVTVVGLSN